MGNKQAKVGEKVVLECLSNGSPKPRVQWMKDGILLTASNKHYITTDGQLLIIMETNTDDKGIYQCVITNSLGVQVQEFEVLIIPCKYYYDYDFWKTCFIAYK